MEEDDVLVDTLKSRGLSCGKLKSVEDRERREAGDFRKLGFSQIAEAQEASANRIKELRRKVCKLR